MFNTLILMRHAKSDWNNNLDDYDRPLNKRGQKSIPLVGNCLQQEQIRLDVLYASPAMRAAQTAKAICAYCDYVEENIIWQPDLYLASLETLLSQLSQIPQSSKTAMLVGHNPGLESLLMYLIGGDALPKQSPLFPTAAIAILEFSASWNMLSSACAALVKMVKPRDFGI